MKKTKIKFFCSLSIYGSLGVLFFTTSVETSSYAATQEYNVQTILPENQIDKSKNDFDLKMKAGETQTIYFYINNTSDHKSDYTVSINQAYTNASGFIDYTDATIEADETLTHSIDNIVKYEPFISLEAHSSLKYPIQITMPKEEFQGQIMAGINISNRLDNSETKIDYTIGLTLTENNHELERLLNITKITPMVQLGELKMIIQIQNPTMIAYNELTYVTRITNKKSKKMIFSETHNFGQQLAPNSTFNLIMNWDAKTINASNYGLDVIVTDGLGTQWIFDETFEITTEEAQKLNTLIQNYRKKLIVRISFTLSLIIGTYFLFLKLTKKQKDSLHKNKTKLPMQMNQTRSKNPKENLSMDKHLSPSNKIHPVEPIERKKRKRVNEQKMKHPYS